MMTPDLFSAEDVVTLLQSGDGGSAVIPTTYPGAARMINAAIRRELDAGRLAIAGAPPKIRGASYTKVEIARHLNSHLGMTIDEISRLLRESPHLVGQWVSPRAR